MEDGEVERGVLTSSCKNTPIIKRRRILTRLIDKNQRQRESISIIACDYNKSVTNDKKALELSSNISEMIVLLSMISSQEIPHLTSLEVGEILDISMELEYLSGTG